MPVSDWSDEEDQSARSDLDGVDARAAMSESRRLLHDLRDASFALGDSLVRAGLSADAWHEPDALLAEISDQSPLTSVDTLLTRLTEFAASNGPQWLAGDGAALDDFEHEARALASIARPLRALAQRERLAPPADRSSRPLGRALADARVGTQLDRLARTLQRLYDLAPLLAPLPPEAQPSAAHDAPAAPLDAAPALEAEPVLARAGPGRTEPWAAPDAAGDDPTIARVPRGRATGIPIEDDGAADAPTYVMDGPPIPARHDAPTVPAWHARQRAPIWPGDDTLSPAVRGRRRRSLVLGLAALLIGAGALGLALGMVLPSLGSAGQPTLTGAQATALAGQLARAATATYTLSTPTLGPPTSTPVAPARLAVSPTSLRLPCPSRGSVALTLTNTGGQSLTWQANVSAGVVLSAYTGALDPGASTTVTVSATSIQRGSSSITFRWDGGSVGVSYRVFCH